MKSSDATHPDVIVGELALVDGQRQTDFAHMALLTPPRRARSDRRCETMLVFLDLGASGTSGLARAMLDHFGRTYWRRPGPVTSALRQAINAANTHLREENRLMPVSHRRRGGLTCAVLRDDCVYLAYIGPAKALLIQGDRATWFAAQPDDDLPLGVSTGLDIRFAHEFVSAGDRLLLTGDHWSGGISDSFFAEALCAERITDVLLALERQVASGTVSSLIAECAPGEESAEPSSRSEYGLHPSEPVSRSSDAVVQEPLASADPNLQNVGRYDPLVPLFESVPAVQAAFEPAEPDGLSHLDAASRLSTGVASGDIISNSVEPEGRSRSARPLVSFSFRGERLNRSRRGLRQASNTLGSGVSAALRRILPDPGRGSRRGAPSSENIPAMAGVAIAIPFLIAFLVVTFYLQRGDTQRHGSLLQQVRTALDAAQQPDAGDDRTLWTTALQTAEDALAVLPDDEELLAMRNQARARLDELDSVVRFELTPLGDYGLGQDRRLAATRSQVYVLDTVQDDVSLHMLDSSGQNANGAAPSLVTYREHTVGDESIGELRDIAWLSAADPWTKDALIILTEDNRMLQHNPSWGLSWLPFESELTSQQVRVLKPYDGKLYALDPQQGEVWRLPYSDGSFGPPEAYFRVPVPDLSNAIDMTIDGAVYILLADARIYKFFGGESEPYDIQGLPGQLSQPIALVSEGDSTTGALYVADAGTQSIVALTKDGRFINQFKAVDSALADLEALTIDEDSRTLFALANGRLYALALPLLPEPPGGSE
jgi:hypothetical protein